MKVVYLKLINGEHILGELVSKNDTEIIVKKPLSVSVNPMSSGLAMIPYEVIFLGKELETINFKTEHIMHEFEPVKEMIDEYTRYRTGIVSAPQNNKIIS